MIVANDNELPLHGVFDDLEPHSFDLIMADPPWLFKLRSEKNLTKSPQGKYRCQPLSWIKRLPVHELASENSALILWATNPMLNQAFEVMSAWGYEFKTAGHWAKLTKNGKQSFGTGYLLRCAGEPFLIGTRGKIKTSRSLRSVIMGLARENSRKPEEAYREFEKWMPDARRLDLFTRQSRPGWTPWGDESNKFDDPLQALPLAA